MTGKKKIIAAFSLLCTTGSATQLPACRAATSTETLTAAVRADKDIAPGAPLRISLSGDEAEVYTVVGAKAADVGRDCKIDAALIAKTLMKTDSSITIARVRFFDERTNTYAEVEVHLGDVASFSTGSITEEQLLKSLKLIVYAAPGGSVLKKSPNVAVSANMDKFSQDGLTFIHPGAWVFHDIDNKWFMGQLDYSDHDIWTALQIRKYNDAQTQAMAMGWDNDWWKGHGIKVLKKRTGKIGSGRYDALFVDCIDTTSRQRYQTHVFFGDKTRGIYGLKLLYDKRVTAKMTAVFDKMLETVRIEQ